MRMFCRNRKVAYDDGSTPKICIIGTGFGGICVAARLKRTLGICSFTMIEKNQDVGGVWFNNMYPGAACDIPGHFYSFSFAQKADWKAFYPEQQEILQYLKDTCTKFDLYPHIEFNTTVKSVTWNEDTQTWTVVKTVKDSKDEISEEFNMVIVGTGIFHKPNYPEEYMSFKGPIIHSAAWDPSVRLENKVVGVIGSAASAMQVVPAIAKRTKELVVFQRTATWVLPRIFEMRFFLMRIILTVFPALLWILRICCFLGGEFFYATHRRGTVINWGAGLVCKTYLYMKVRNRKLASRFVPTYKYGYKPVYFSNKFHSTFKLPHVQLNDSTIVKVEDRKITTADGQTKELDVLILCTGFRVQDFFSPMQIIGKNGVDTFKMWANDRPRTYYGMTWDSCPNLFMILGPNSQPGHSSSVFTIECQTNFILECIRKMIKRDAKSIQVKSSAQNECMNEILSKYKETTWSKDPETQISTWIYNQKGDVTTYWPNSSTNYWWKTRRVDSRKFNFTPRKYNNNNKVWEIV